MKWTPYEILKDIPKSEVEIMCNGEHYATMSETRKKILEIALDIENGFYAEVGACMGTDTKFLEACGWKGILVEPDKNLYKWLSNTRNCIVERCGLVSHQYYKNSNKISDRTMHVFSLPDYINGYEREDIRRIRNYEAIPFSILVKKHNIKKIDIFILDVEGMEIEVMDGINFDEVDIRNLIIECNTDKYSLSTLDEYMSNRGYINMGSICQSGVTQYDYHYKKLN